MRLRKFCSLLLVLFLSCVISFSVVSPVKAAAVTLPSGGHYMSPADTLSFIGNSIPATYYNGSEYVDMTFEYQASFTMSSTGYNVFSEVSENPVSYMTLDGTPYLLYQGQFSNISLNPQYITAHFQPHYSIFDTDWLYTGFALSSSSSSPSSSVYDSPQSNWYLGGTIHNFYNSSDSTSSSGVKAYLQSSSSWNSEKYTYIPIFNTSVSAFSSYCQDVSFYGNSPNSTYYYNLFVMCPYVSGSASGASGTFTNGSAVTTSPSGGSDVDLTETNGLLESIRNGISGIGQTILGLFVPDDEFMTQWIDDMQDLLHDHLGGMYEAVSALEDFWEQFENVQAKSVIHIGECRLPLAGSELVLGNWDVPLKPTGIPQVLYTSLALIIDFLAVMAFLRMCRNKLEIILNPNSEVVKE